MIEVARDYPILIGYIRLKLIGNFNLKGSKWCHKNLIHIFKKSFFFGCYKKLRVIDKVEKNLKGSLVSIPSPSVKTKSLLTSPSNVLPYYLK